MPDFRAYVREHLPPLDVPGAREAEIIEELAIEFEESYARRLAAGSTPDEAWQQVLRSARPWHELAEELRSELRHGYHSYSLRNDPGTIRDSRGSCTGIESG